MSQQYNNSAQQRQRKSDDSNRYYLVSPDPAVISVQQSQSINYSQGHFINLFDMQTSLNDSTAGIQPSQIISRSDTFNGPYGIVNYSQVQVVGVQSNQIIVCSPPQNAIALYG